MLNIVEKQLVLYLYVCVCTYICVCVCVCIHTHIYKINVLLAVLSVLKDVTILTPILRIAVRLNQIKAIPTK